MSLLEDDVLDESLGNDILLLDAAIGLLLLSYDDALTLGLEEYTTGSDSGGSAVFLLVDTDRGESYLEDANACEMDFLTEFEIVLDSLTQLLKHGDDVALLHRGLGLDELGELFSLDELRIIHCLRKVLVVGFVETVVVFGFNVLLTHNLKLKDKSEK